MIKTQNHRPLILVTGPTRSGKSEWAEDLAANSGLPVVYVATAAIDPQDQDWQARILVHQQRRPPEWETVEAPMALAEIIACQPAATCLVIDSLGTWLANLLAQEEKQWSQTLQELLTALAQTNCHVIIVGEEVGWGVIPPSASGRLFRDRMGVLLRQIGAIADQVYLVTAGYAINIKALGSYVRSIRAPGHLK